LFVNCTPPPRSYFQQILNHEPQSTVVHFFPLQYVSTSLFRPFHCHPLIPWYVVVGVALRPNVGHGLLIHEVSRPHTVGRTFLDEW
jgi:hypothetical protein